MIRNNESQRTITNSGPSSGFDGNIEIDENGDTVLGGVGKVLLSPDDLTPTQNDQIASKLYVDAEISSVVAAIPPDVIGITSLNPTGTNTNSQSVTAEGAAVDIFCTGTGLSINGDDVLKRVTFDVSGLNTATSLKVNKAGDTMTGPLIIPSGSGGAPGIGFRFEQNTGIAKLATGQIDFVTMGTSRCTVDNLGLSLPGGVTANNGFSTTGNIIVGGTVDGVDVSTLPGLIGTAQTTANNALPKIGGVLGSNLDMANYDLVNVDSISTDTIAASTGTTVQVVSNLNMNSKSISGIGSITNGLGLQPLRVDFVTSNLATLGNVFAAGIGQFGAIAPAAGTSISMGGSLNFGLNNITGISSITNGLGSFPLDINFGASNLITSGLVDGVDISARDAVLTSTTTTALNALPTSGGTMTGDIITSGLVDGVDISARDAVLTSTTTTANNALPKINPILGSNLNANLFGITNIASISKGIDEDISFADSNILMNTGEIKCDKFSSTTNSLMTFNNNVSMNSNSISGVGSITNGQGATPLNLNFGASNLVTSGLVDGVDISARDAVLTSTTTTAINALPKAGGTMTGAVVVVNGSLAVPSINFTNSATTGIYSPVAGSLSLVNAGTARITTTTTGATHTGISDIASLTGCGYSVIYANAAAFPPLFTNNALVSSGVTQTAITLTAGKLIRLYKIGITSAYMFRIVFTATVNREQINGYIPEFTNFGLSTAILGINTNDTGRFWKYSPDFDGLFYISANSGFQNGTTYDIIGSMIMTQDFDV
jgi:hypothetical protein